MKRSFSLINSGATPRGQPPGLPTSKSSTGTRGKTAKRQRGTGGKGMQTTLKPFLRVNTPLSAQDTPSLQPHVAPGTTGATTALGNLRILSNTPSTDLPSLGVHVAPRVASRYCKDQQQTGSPADEDGLLHKADQDDDDEDDFRIVSSQTYHRPATQLEDTNSSWQDTWTDRSADAFPDDGGPNQGRPGQATQGSGQGADEDGITFLTQPMLAAAPKAELPDHHHVPGLTPTQLAASGTQQPSGPPQPTCSEATAGIPRPAHSGNESVQAQAVTPELAPILVGLPGNGAEATSQHGVDDGLKPQAVAPLFKKATERKLLILVRHGESEYNAAIRTSRSVADPYIFDARLTARGVQQCGELRGELLKLVDKYQLEFGEPLWVISPLTRAIQTFLHSCPYPERLPACHPPAQLLPPAPQSHGAQQHGMHMHGGQQALIDATNRAARESRGRIQTGAVVKTSAGANTSSSTAGRSSWPVPGTTSFSSAFAGASGACSSWHAQLQVAGSQVSSTSGCSAAISMQAPGQQHAQQPPAAVHLQQPMPLNVAVLPGIAELMATPGDVGRPPAHLIREFPQLAAQLGQLPEVWWHHTPAAASCALSKKWVGGESSECCTRRVQEFASWLQKRPERLVILVGHSMFWQKFLGKSAGKQPLKNCGFMTLTW